MNEKFFRGFINEYSPIESELENDPTRFNPPTHYLYTHGYRFYRMINFLEGKKFQNVLDVGCYPGTLIRLIKHFYPETRINGAGLGLTKKFTSCFSEIIFQDSMDIVFACEVIEHLYNPYHMLKEIYRILKPGGFCYFTTNNISSLAGISRIIRGNTPLDPQLRFTTVNMDSLTDWRGHVRYYCTRELKEVMKNVGFSKIMTNHFTKKEYIKSSDISYFKMVIKNFILSFIPLGCFKGYHECIARK